jgi:hypothetical protein
VSPVRYKLGFYIPEDDILHSDRRENLRSYTDCYLVPELQRNLVNAQFSTVTELSCHR